MYGHPKLSNIIGRFGNAAKICKQFFFHTLFMKSLFIARKWILITTVTCQFPTKIKFHSRKVLSYGWNFFFRYVLNPYSFLESAVLIKGNFFFHVNLIVDVLRQHSSVPTLLNCYLRTRRTYVQCMYIVWIKYLHTYFQKIFVMCTHKLRNCSFRFIFGIIRE